MTPYLTQCTNHAVWHHMEPDPQLRQEEVCEDVPCPTYAAKHLLNVGSVLGTCFKETCSDLCGILLPLFIQDLQGVKNS